MGQRDGPPSYRHFAEAFEGTAGKPADCGAKHITHPNLTSHFHERTGWVVVEMVKRNVRRGNDGQHLLVISRLENVAAAHIGRETRVAVSAFNELVDAAVGGRGQSPGRTATVAAGSQLRQPERAAEGEAVTRLRLEGLADAGRVLLVGARACRSD